MGDRHLYFTHLIACEEVDLVLPGGELKARGWSVVFKEDSRPEPPVFNGRLVFVRATSRDAAQKASNQIGAALNLIVADHLVEYIPVVPSDELAEGPEDQSRRLPTSSTPGIPLACRLAAKASFRKKYQYCLAKYHLATRLCSVPFVDLDPHHAPHFPVSSLPEDHVLASTSIILSYSIIEELGFDVRANRKRPSLIKGKWNPAVRCNLESRLSESRIRTNEPFLWLQRGAPTRIARTRRIPTLASAPWAYAHVRDKEVSLCDAIAYASWLRSRIASHKLGPLAGSLSMYDVTSVRHLARRLLLETLGFWRAD